MIKHYQDYCWKMGKPVGKGVVEANAPVSYKIIIDPYFKRYSIEKYLHGNFEKVIYDSYLLDFRHLNPKEQAAWQREILYEDDKGMRSLLRNIDDRAILIEELTFENGQCRTCNIKSIHGIPVSTHKMYYNSLSDPFDGVILYDTEGRPVMKKTYRTDPGTGEFTELISESWEITTDG